MEQYAGDSADREIIRLLRRIAETAERIEQLLTPPLPQYQPAAAIVVTPLG
jgi:hypothetical protein